MADVKKEQLKALKKAAKRLSHRFGRKFVIDEKKWREFAYQTEKKD